MGTKPIPNESSRELINGLTSGRECECLWVVERQREVTVFWEDVYGWMSIPVCIGMYFLVWSCVWEIRDQSLEWLSSLGTICFEQPPLAWNFARCARALVGQ